MPGNGAKMGYSGTLEIANWYATTIKKSGG